MALASMLTTKTSIGLDFGNMLFLEFFCWLSGSTHDARILRNSTLYQRAEQGHKLTGPVVDGDGHEIDPYALGYSAYPISP